jgi:predicted acylesterase/phospholipase RssA
LRSEATAGPSIGIALSGGGHRASLWALGVLLYLADAGKNREVVAISSVSGGSIANGVVAHEIDYAQADADGLEASVAPLVRHIANEGLFFWGRSTNRYVISVFLMAALALGTFGTGVVLVALGGLDLTSGIVLGAGLLLFLLAVWRFRRRSVIVDRALARTHFATNGKPTPLASVARSVDHIFCATELQAGDHLYLSPRFVYAYRFGVGSPADLPLSTAVQASACLPGAFAARRLPTDKHAFAGAVVERPPEEMVLVDGGVYDNMADQWLAGLDERLRERHDLDVAGTQIDEAIVVNASAGRAWRPFPGSGIPLLAEFAVLKRVNDVMYDVTTSRRRRHLVEDWERSDEAGGGGMRGGLVHIAQSPFRVAEQFADHPTRGERACAILELLGDDEEHRELWDARARSSSQVKTVLRKLGVPTSVALLEHAYVLAMCNLHVLLGYPRLELPSRERFTRLAVSR